jgi:UDP-N-acetylglucosamine--N-acetylmuramyl-(pentapeptide) pyrophosphoryl-undecaprenol N-acetylglucosamine transferase
LSARRILRRERPDAVLGMGGYVSVPAGLAAAAAGVPLLLHEQNSRAGLANRLLARWARGVAVSFEKTEGLPPAARTEWTGLPLRPDLAPTDPAAARKSLGLSEDALTVLVFGGSQGARALNRLLIRSLPALSAFKERWQFIHLTGESEFAAVQAAYNTMGWRAFVRAYHHEMGVLYSAADVAVCRSGANTVMELARMGRRALLIPYPHAADNHQEFNARYLEAQGLARVELEEGLTEERFGAFLRSLPEPRALREEARIRVESLPQSWLDAPARLAAWVVKEASR